MRILLGLLRKLLLWRWERANGTLLARAEIQEKLHLETRGSVPCCLSSAVQRLRAEKAAIERIGSKR